MCPTRVGAAMKAVLLLSGGIDSPVAGEMVRRQGVELEALHCSFEPFTDDASVRKAMDLARLLGLRRLWVARIGDTLSRIASQRDAHRFYFVLQKRLFYRLADVLAERVGADVVVTGENIGQVSSQTLSNLATIEGAATRPVVRPLLGLDKMEIVGMARDYGTYETSLGPELCDVLGPDRPATVSRVEVVEGHERAVGLDRDLPEIEELALPAPVEAS